MTDLTNLTIAELAPQLRERQLSPVELTEAYLQRIERLDGQLNSYIRVMADEARAAAREAESEIGRGAWRGPLHGVPLGIKDLFDVAGVPNTLGSKIMRDNVPATDCTVVQRLRDAGAVILGKQNLHEFAFGITSENPHYGVVRNPWDLDRVPGGSSGGTAAAVAAGLCVAGMGSDTGASIRASTSSRPASKPETSAICTSDRAVTSLLPRKDSRSPDCRAREFRRWRSQSLHMHISRPVRSLP